MSSVTGEVEGKGKSWHGHVTAVNVAPKYHSGKAHFVDLLVRGSKIPAIKMHQELGYVVYRRVLQYYSWVG